MTEEDRGTFREVIAFAPLTVAPWGVAVEQEEAELLAPALELRRKTILFGTATLAGVLLLAWLIVRSIVQPVRQLVAASGRIAAGDLATPVPPLGEDEIGELGQAFDEMRQRLAQWGEELERKVAERTRELSILYAIDCAAAQSLELDEILNDALEKTLEVLEIEAGDILLMEPEGETMTLQVHRGLSEEFVQAVQRMKVGEGISGQAVAEGKPVVLGDQLLGVLVLFSRQPLDEEMLDVLGAFVNQVAVALSNARLFAERQQRIAELAAWTTASGWTRGCGNLQSGEPLAG